MMLVLIVDRANVAYRGRTEGADLLRAAGLPFGQEIDNTALAHVTLPQDTDLGVFGAV